MSISAHGSRTRYRTLSAVASNVATAAALAAQHEQVREHQRQGSILPHHHRGVGSSASLLSGHVDAEEEEMDENLVSTLADSYHSEGGHNIGRKRVNWSMERHGGRGGSVGRHSQRQGTLSGYDVAPEHGEVSTISPTIRHNTASRQSAGLAFLSVFALFSVGHLVGLKTNQGSVIARQVTPINDLSPVHSAPIYPPNPIDFDPATPYAPTNEDAGASYVTVEIPKEDNLAINSETTNERIIGRLFAWLCTTLYLTSRLPQIWKNVRGH
ncbi:hypothetical protein V5O48_000476 [Marasmius crinis-equi]|uniref:Transmembrane protein n=1 Tax=Marasmius crinis-equi TaxID=585013 RepID=A0ABR3G1D5_9AGAR